MIGLIFIAYAGLLRSYKKKWHEEKIDRQYNRFEEDMRLRDEYGFEYENYKPIPKRKIKNKTSRIKHGL